MPSDPFFTSLAGPSKPRQPAQNARPASQPSTRGRHRKTIKGGPSAGPRPKTGTGGMERKRGFQVGPAHAPRNAYLGKAKKIKADLIMKSKIKREYAKVLKEEGMESTRLKPRGRQGEAGALSGPALTVDPSQAQSPTSQPLSPISILQPARSDPSSSRHVPASRSDHSKRPPAQRADSAASKSKERKVLSPADIGPPMPQTSLRELKKEAYKKYHRPRHAPTAAHSGRAGSQPNLGARMGVLLEKIKRDKAAA